MTTTDLVAGGTSGIEGTVLDRLVERSRPAFRMLRHPELEVGPEVSVNPVGEGK